MIIKSGNYIRVYKYCRLRKGMIIVLQVSEKEREKMKTLTLNETEKDILIRALTKFLLSDEKENDRETAGILLMALKKL